MITIDLLTDPADPAVTQISAWYHQWWGEAEGMTLAAVTEFISHCLQTQRLP